MKVFAAILALAGFAASFVSFSYCLEPEPLSVICGLFFGLLFWSLSAVVTIRLIQGATITLLMVSLCSFGTTFYESLHEEYSGGMIAVRNRVRDFGIQNGGTRSVRRADGSSEVNDYQVSFRDAMSAIGVAVSSLSYTAQQSAKYAFDKYQAGQITKQQFNQQMFDLKKYEAAGQGTLVEPGKTLVTPNGAVTAPAL